MASIIRLRRKAFAAILVIFGLPIAMAWGLASSQKKELSPEEKEFMRIPAILAAKPLEASPNDDESQKLRKALYNERVAITARHYQLFRLLIMKQCDTVLDPLRRVKSVGMEIFLTQGEKKLFLEQMLEFSDRVSFVVAQKEAYFRERPSDDTFLLQLQKIREFRLEIQLDLLELKKASDRLATKETK